MQMKVLGVDPGFASQGLAILMQGARTSPIKLLWGTVTRTEKRAGKQKRNLRISDDDQRRFKELCADLDKAHELTDYKLNAVCVEVYTPYRAQGGAAWKSGAAYGGACFWGHTNKIPVLPAIPQDVKRGVCGKVSASKKDVENRICELVGGLREVLEELPKGQREHLSDAAAHAYLGLQEMWDLKLLLT